VTLPQNDLNAVVLSGGGAHGAYEVGVLKALLTAATWTTGGVPLDPNVITGTSIGAYNAAVLMSRLDMEDPQAVADYLEDVWVNVIPRDNVTNHTHVFRFRANPAELLGSLPRHPVAASAAFGNDVVFFAQDWFHRGMSFFTSAGAGSLVERSLDQVDLSTLITREPSEWLLRATILLENLRRSRRLLFIAMTNWESG
jgi:hypothetical protein